MLKSGKGKKVFRVLSKKTVFKGYVSELDVLKIETAGGKRVERELIRHPGAVVIIPKLSDGQMVLIRQLRVATGGKIWEFPAGTLEKGERPIDCAARELQEETGWRPRKLKELLEFYPTPGISTEKMFLFLGEDLVKSKECKPDVDEELTCRIFSLREIDRMIQKGLIIDGKTILGYLFFLKYVGKQPRVG